MNKQYNYINEQKFLCEYRFNGKVWATDLYASSWEEAEQKLKAMGNGKVLGVSGGEFPAQLGFLAKLIVWFRNTFNV